MATALKELLRLLPSWVDDRCSRYRPNEERNEERRMRITAGIKPVEEITLGIASIPVPMIVLARLATELGIEAVWRARGRWLDSNRGCCVL